MPLGMPAGNRWTKLAPVMMQITLMLGFYSLVADALGASAGGEMSDPEDGAPTRPPGTEPDDVGTMRKLARRQCRRAREFASAPESLRRAALWCIVGKRIMTIHYKLFVFGTWFSHSRDSQKRCGVLEFCDERRNPGVVALRELVQLLDLQHEAWTPLWTVLPRGWGVALLEEAQSTIVVCICETWRRLWKPFRRYPWRLTALVDPEREEEAAAEAAGLLSAKECCLDTSFSQRLRQQFGAKAFEPEVQDFLMAMFTRCVVTSTYVERVFAGLTHATRSAQLELPSLKARHVLQNFSGHVERWRASQLAMSRGQRRRSGASRPAWMKMVVPGSRLNGLQMWQKQHLASGAAAGASGAARLQEARAVWKSLPQEERREWQAKAKAERCLRQQDRNLLDAALGDTAGSEVGGGPWGSYAQEGWPLSGATFRRCLANKSIRAVAETWNKDHEAFENLVVGRGEFGGGPWRVSVPFEMVRAASGHSRPTLCLCIEV